MLDQWRVYESDDPVTGYPFTYPPFAAVLMVPLALLPGWLAAALWTGPRRRASPPPSWSYAARSAGRRPGWLVVLVCGGSLALEPVWQNFSFGQINLILMLAVLVDLVRPERRWSGVLVGIAAGVKLTPLVFVVLLVLIGRRGAAARAVARVRRHRRGGARRDAGRRRRTGPTGSSRPAGSGRRRSPTTSRCSVP